MTARRKPEPPKFKPGDIVRLRSGGPPMTVTGNGFQTGRGAERNRGFAAQAKARRLRVDRIVHVAFVSTKGSRADDARWFIDHEELHEDTSAIDIEASVGQCLLDEIRFRIAHTVAVWAWGEIAARCAVSCEAVLLFNESKPSWMVSAERRRSLNFDRIRKKHGGSWALSSTDPGRP